MRSLFILLVTVLIASMTGCATQIQPIGDDVNRCEFSDGTRVYIDWRNGITWSSSGPGEPGRQITICREDDPPSRYLYRFNLRGNDDRFFRVVIDKREAFLVFASSETLEVVAIDTVLPDFFRIQFPEMVVDFDLTLGRIYYHCIHQESFKVTITKLEKGIFLVDEKTVPCYESRVARISNLARGIEYGINVSQGGKSVRGTTIILW